MIKEDLSYRFTDLLCLLFGKTDAINLKFQGFSVQGE